MRESQLAQQLDLVAATGTDRRGGPLADAVYGDDGRLLEGRGIERGGRVRLVMLAEHHLAVVSRDPALEIVGHPELLAEPQRHRHQVRLPPSRRAGRVRLEQAI